MSAQGPEFNPAMQADEPLTPFDVTGSSGRSGMIKLFAGFAVLLALGFIVLRVYHPDGTRDRDDPPLITAENTPFKIVPDDPGGAQTPDQDKEVFDIMAGDQPRSDVITLPPPEDPVERPTMPKTEPAQPQPDAQMPAPDTSSESSSETSTPSNLVPDRTQPVIRPSVPVDTPTQPATGASEWIVQVASLRSQAEAERTFDAISAQHSAIIGSLGSDIARVDLAEKGIYYRARVAGFADRAAANRTCERLKAAGQSCFVTRR